MASKRRRSTFDVALSHERLTSIIRDEEVAFGRVAQAAMVPNDPSGFADLEQDPRFGPSTVPPEDLAKGVDFVLSKMKKQKLPKAFASKHRLLDEDLNHLLLFWDTIRPLQRGFYELRLRRRDAMKIKDREAKETKELELSRMAASLQMFAGDMDKGIMYNIPDKFKMFAIDKFNDVREMDEHPLVEEDPPNELMTNWSYRYYNDAVVDRPLKQREIDSLEDWMKMFADIEGIAEKDVRKLVKEIRVKNAMCKERRKTLEEERLSHQLGTTITLAK